MNRPLLKFHLPAQKLIVAKSLIDFLEKPTSQLAQDYSHQDYRLSQLLYGERLEVLEEREEWLKVHALEQMNYVSKWGWTPYSGWIRKSETQSVEQFPKTNAIVAVKSLKVREELDLLFGSHVTFEQGKLDLPHFGKISIDSKSLRPYSPTFCHTLLEKDIELFMDSPYLWGGRSVNTSSCISSVDCSGLINLLYRAQNIEIPRNAHPQFLFGKPTCKAEFGDAVYLTRNSHNPLCSFGQTRFEENGLLCEKCGLSRENEKMTHVLLKLKGPYYLEAPESGKKIRKLKLGQDIEIQEERLFIKDRKDPYFYHFRRFY